MTNTTKKITASTIAAALITGGVLLYNDKSDNVQEPFKIDWSIYDLNIPTINVTSVNTPTIDTTSVNTPTIDTTFVNTPTIDTTFVNTPTIDIASVNVSNKNLTTIKSSINTPIIENIKINNIFMKEIVTNVNVVDLNKNIYKVINFASDLPQWMQIVQISRELFVDQRSIEHDNVLNKQEVFIKWTKIYKEYKNMPYIKYVSIDKPFRMITEVGIPKNLDSLNILTENLKYYKSQGYDSVLVVFNKDDNSQDVLNTIKYIKKYLGMNVWLAYTGKELLTVSVFMDLDKYTSILTNCAPYISGYINSWRRTSAHLWEQDKAFMNYTNITLRRSNPNLPIVGELYYGNTHKYDKVNYVGFGLNNFENSSAIMIVNFGFKRIDVNYLTKFILSKYVGKTPLIACVVGHKPYYMTTNNNGYDYKTNMKIKHEVEQVFLRNGYIGVVTLSNDGKEMETNNLSTTLYNTLQGK